jgi:predicted amidophosphoribosyltransferase
VNADLICPVCGYPGLSQPPYDEHGDPLYEICPCCGFEFGVHDAVRDYSFERYREEWIKDGFRFRHRPVPKNWSKRQMQAQLKNVEQTNWSPILL